MSNSEFKLSKKLIPLAVSAVCLNMSVTTSAQADAFTEALTGGTPTVDLRVRYEGVEQDNKKDASALTERIRVGYKTGDFNGFSAFVEMSDTASLGDRHDYFTPGPNGGGDSDRAVVLDPTFTILNRANIAYTSDMFKAKVGKQRIIFDNRFLGNVGWRQKEQIYSGGSLSYTPSPLFNLDYAYIVNANNPIGVDLEMDSHAAKVTSNIVPGAKLSAFAYLLDFEEGSGTDSATYGARLEGKTAISENAKLLYHVALATQKEYEDSNDIGGDYSLVELGVNLGPAVLKVGQETLGGDGDSSFQTPLGTVHLYNGWADMFIGPLGGTPVNGLVDQYISVSGKALGMKLAAIYHDYTSDKASDDYGSEYNLLAAKKFNKTYSAGIKYASYDAGDDLTTRLVDTNKLWIWGEAKF